MMGTPTARVAMRNFLVLLLSIVPACSFVQSRRPDEAFWAKYGKLVAERTAIHHRAAAVKANFPEETPMYQGARDRFERARFSMDAWIGGVSGCVAATRNTCEISELEQALVQDCQQFAEYSESLPKPKGFFVPFVLPIMAVVIEKSLVTVVEQFIKQPPPDRSLMVEHLKQLKFLPFDEIPEAKRVASEEDRLH